jgi:hypothetical protein
MATDARSEGNLQHESIRCTVSSSWIRVRNETVYDEKWDYALQNPVRAGLVTNTE